MPNSTVPAAATGLPSNLIPFPIEADNCEQAPFTRVLRKLEARS